MENSRHIAVIGAGIVGVCCAAWLQRKGWQVSLVDHGEPGHGTSFGNTGVIAPSAFLPVAMPGMLKQVPKWIIDPHGPLRIRWSYLPQLAPWLLRFVRCTNVEQMERSAAAMRTLVEPVLDCYAPLLRNAGNQELVREGGSLFVYESEEAFAADQRMISLRRKFGTDLVELRDSEIRALEPALAQQFRWATYARENMYTVNPQRLTATLAAQVGRDGGELIRCRVNDIAVEDGSPVLKTSGGDLRFPKVLIAAGAWSKVLAARVGDKVPLETQRGYHVTMADPGVTLGRTISWVRHRIFTTPMEMGLRIAGGVELAGLRAAPNWARAEKMIGIAKAMYPDLNVERKTFWMGHRPCLPDSLPVIGRSRKSPNVFYAFGHQHVGMCSAAATGRTIAELVSGERPQIDVTPFRPDRF
jgi:D-amino-acid dehydrogenase